MRWRTGGRRTQLRTDACGASRRRPGRGGRRCAPATPSACAASGAGSTRSTTSGACTPGRTWPPAGTAARWSPPRRDESPLSAGWAARTATGSSIDHGGGDHHPVRAPRPHRPRESRPAADGRPAASSSASKARPAPAPATHLHFEVRRQRHRRSTRSRSWPSPRCPPQRPGHASRTLGDTQPPGSAAGRRRGREGGLRLARRAGHPAAGLAAQPAAADPRPDREALPGRRRAVPDPVDAAGRDRDGGDRPRPQHRAPAPPVRRG